ncbi:MAG: hypothetical protein GC145_06090 [Caulobacter sp.]|nr:hypothetical protein [Caulobacter sp.]
MIRGDRLRVIDDAPLDQGPGRKTRKPPFRQGDLVTCRSARGEGPDAIVELERHRGFFRAARFETVER